MVNLNHNRTRHGMWKTRQYRIWNSMLNRCRNKKSNNWKNYGAKGITVCDRWHTFELFWEDMQKGYTDAMTIDRIDNSKGYSPDNCRWVDAKEQGRNKASVKRYKYKGKLLTVPQLAELHGLKYGTLRERLKRGWGLKEALSTKLITRYEDQHHRRASHRSGLQSLQ